MKILGFSRISHASPTAVCTVPPMDDGRDGSPLLQELAMVSFGAGLLLLLPRQWASFSGCMLLAVLFFIWHREGEMKKKKAADDKKAGLSSTK